jgi:hypothetical protein
MKTTRIAESGAIDRLAKFFSTRQAALADRLQQMLDSLGPRDVKQPDGTVWPVPQGAGVNPFTVAPAPTQDSSQELVYVKDTLGREVLVDPVVALPYLQNIPPDGITPSVVWEALNQASAETQTSALMFNPQDEAAESAWDQAITAAQRKKAASEVEDEINRQAEFYESQLDEDTKRKIRYLNADLYTGPLFIDSEDPDSYSSSPFEGEGYVAFDFVKSGREVMDLLQDLVQGFYADGYGGTYSSESEAMEMAREGMDPEDENISMPQLFEVDSGQIIEKILGKELYNTIR